MFDRLADDKGHGDALSALARMGPERIKAEAEAILPELGTIEVIQSRTGLVMLPMRDSVQGTDFHLGEVLVAEAHVHLVDHETDGYGLIVGRDLERAMAMALIDGARAAGIARDRLDALIAEETAKQAAADRETLREVEATRVDMETF